MVSLEDRGHVHESWWSTYGKPIGYLLLGIVGVVAAVLVALIIAGAIF
jgi:hypothetical protein